MTQPENLATVKVRSAASERMARSRQRKRDRLTWLEIELRATELDGLVRRGFLAVDKRHDKAAITEGFYRWLDETNLGDET